MVKRALKCQTKPNSNLKRGLIATIFFLILPECLCIFQRSQVGNHKGKHEHTSFLKMIGFVVIIGHSANFLKTAGQHDSVER